jgi:hypothetical protein
MQCVADNASCQEVKNHHILAEMTSRDAFAPLLFIHVFKMIDQRPYDQRW